MTRHAKPVLLALAFLLLPLGVEGQDSNGVVQWDPTTIDTTPIDRQNPPTLRPIRIDQGGVRLNGLAYLADGPGPHATIVMLRDFPGWETNADVAQSLRRAGFNVMMVDYAGSWGSPGEFSWSGAVESVGAMIDFLRSEAATDYRVDSDRIQLVGAGFGAWAGIAAAAEHPVVECIAGIGFWDPAAAAQIFAAGGPTAEELREIFATAIDPEAGPIHADLDRLIAELADSADEMALNTMAAGVRGKTFMIVSGTRAEVDPLRQTMRPSVVLSSLGAGSVERSVVSDGPLFSEGRIRLSRSVVSWFESRCPAF